MAVKSGSFRMAGFTLAEALVWLGLVAVIGGILVEWRSTYYLNSVAEKTAYGFEQFETAARSYYLDNASWPPDITVLQTYIPNLKNIDAVAHTAGVNGAGLPYALSLNVDGGLLLSTTLLTLQQAVAVHGKYPNSGAHDASTFVVTIGIPVPTTSSSGAAGLFLGGTRSGVTLGSVNTSVDCAVVGGIWFSIRNPDDGLCFSS